MLLGNSVSKRSAVAAPGSLETVTPQLRLELELMPPVECGVSIHTADRRTVFTVTGEVDACTAPMLHERLERLLRVGPVDLDVDLRSVTFLDASALTFLLIAQRRVTELGRLFRICGDNDLLPRLLDATGLSEQLGGSRR